MADWFVSRNKTARRLVPRWSKKNKNKKNTRTVTQIPMPVGKTSPVLFDLLRLPLAIVVPYSMPRNKSYHVCAHHSFDNCRGKRTVTLLWQFAREMLVHRCYRNDLVHSNNALSYTDKSGTCCHCEMVYYLYLYLYYSDMPIRTMYCIVCIYCY